MVDAELAKVEFTLKKLDERQVDDDLAVRYECIDFEKAGFVNPVFEIRITPKVINALKNGDRNDFIKRTIGEAAKPEFLMALVADLGLPEKE